MTFTSLCVLYSWWMYVKQGCPPQLTVARVCKHQASSHADAGTVILQLSFISDYCMFFHHHHLYTSSSGRPVGCESTLLKQHLNTHKQQIRTLGLYVDVRLWPVVTADSSTLFAFTTALQSELLGPSIKPYDVLKRMNEMHLVRWVTLCDCHVALAGCFGC
jgi:hypothetical protein